MIVSHCLSLLEFTFFGGKNVLNKLLLSFADKGEISEEDPEKGGQYQGKIYDGARLLLQ
jgi:hypothetical protein